MTPPQAKLRLANRVRAIVSGRRFNFHLNLKIVFIVWTLLLCSLYLWRTLWAWPDVTWQSQFWFIEDINTLLNGRIADTVWFEWGGGQATNGYRWLIYLNAIFFGLNAQIETVTYALLLSGVSIAVGLRILRSQRYPKSFPNVLVFSIPAVLLSFTGSLARGMELGTFTGLAILVFFLLTLNNEVPSVTWKISTFVLCTSLFFIFLGGYALGVTAAALAVAVLAKYCWKHEPVKKINFFAGSLMAATLLFGTSLLVGGKGESSQSIAKLMSLQSNDFLFAPSFLSTGFANSVITSNSLEMFPIETRFAIAFAVSISMATLIVVSILGVRGSVNTKDIAPLVLIAYAPANYIMLLFFRPNDLLQLINPWYALHSKIALVGLIWLVALNWQSLKTFLSKNFLLRIFTAGLVAVLLGVYLFSNSLQVARHNFERVYFLNALSATLNPDLISRDSELTPLVLNYKDSMRAIELLRNNELGAYRDLSASVTLLSGGKKFVTQGDLYIDGWSGEEFSIRWVNSMCSSIMVTFVNFGDETNTVTVTRNGQSEIYTVDSANLVLHERFSSPLEIVSFRAGKSWVPKQLGINDDTRALSFKTSFTCESK